MHIHLISAILVSTVNISLVFRYFLDAKLENTKSKKKNSQFIVRLNDMERTEFVELCEELDTSAAREVRRFIRCFIAENKKQT